ncbi:MAG: HD domain-containing protein [Candidatus Aenigmarchaeota archaeon]|nr:HD domain-containing protein [Candidatus Aenigmarchaeota archaeon]
MKSSELRKLAKLIFECGQLKRTPRSGWTLLGIKNPESVAEHSWRAAVIGLFLAKSEGADENKVIKICLLHDIAEGRTGDINKVADRYIKDKGEREALKEILGKLFDNDLLEIAEEYEDRKTKESVIARDADLLELFVQAREYEALGSFGSVSKWMGNSRKAMKTKTAKLLAREIASTEPYSWLRGLKKIPKLTKAL